MSKRKRLKLNRSIRAGIRIGTVILTATATVKLAILGWRTLEARAGAPGGELLILPLIGLLFYTGWTARKDYVAFRRSYREERGRENANKIGRASCRERV